MPIQRITMMNYGFGDCFLAEGFGSKMLIDCGSLAKPDNMDEVLRKTARRFSSGREEHTLVVTHLHSDHFNQLKNLVPLCGGCSLDAVYMPNMFESKIIAVSFLVMRLLSQDEDPNVYDFYHAVLTSLFDISSLIDDSTEIYMLDRRNISFENSIGSFRVLWPDMDFLKPIWDEPFPEGFENRVFSSYQEYLSHFFASESSRDREGEGGKTYHRVKEPPTEDEVDRKIKEIAGEKNDDEKLTDAQKRKLTDLANNYSLVFDEECSFHRMNGCIFFGDATRTAIKRIHGDFKPWYSVVKVPHHGTRDYWSPDLPDGEVYLIPFGERSGYFLDDAYFWRTTSLSFIRMTMSMHPDYSFYYGASAKIDIIPQVSIAVTLLPSLPIY
jgi:ribonuclease BN (tRNA processing enzyme)